MSDDSFNHGGHPGRDDDDAAREDHHGHGPDASDASDASDGPAGPAYDAEGREEFPRRRGPRRGPGPRGPVGPLGPRGALGPRGPLDPRGPLGPRGLVRPGRGPRERVFGHGDLKFVVLDLLRDRPRHGYDIIREMENRFGGAYSPSPGTIYPTLSLLEDMGYARARAEEGSRRVYEITDQGRAYLDENRSVVDGISGRVERAGAFHRGRARDVLGRALGELGNTMMQAAMRHHDDEQWVQRAREILQRAARDIEGLEGSRG